MIKSLRKKHRQVWTAAALLLPAGIILAWLAIPNLPYVKLLEGQPVELLPVRVATKIKVGYSVALRSNAENTQWQLEWKNKHPLTVPSAVIYRATGTEDSITKNELVGRIEARGDYVFPLAQGAWDAQFVLYDFIHKQIIDSINFQP